VLFDAAPIYNTSVRQGITLICHVGIEAGKIGTSPSASDPSKQES
jgi:hypothetical protein